MKPGQYMIVTTNNEEKFRYFYKILSFEKTMKSFIVVLAYRDNMTTTTMVDLDYLNSGRFNYELFDDEMQFHLMRSINAERV